MKTIIEQAREAWENKRSKMTREDWMLVGQALVEGKKWCEGRKGYGGPKGFGRWCKENGFGEIDFRDRTDAMWMVTDGAVFLSHNAIINHPRAIRAAHRAQNEAEIQSKTEAIIGHLGKAKEPMTARQLADAFGVSPEYVSKGTTTWERQGLIERVPDTKPVQWKKGPGKPPEPPKPMTVEGLLELDAKQAGVSVEEHMLRKVAEDMYWLNVMLARKINGGTTTTIQTTIDQQEAAFSAWAHSFHEASGRSSVLTEKTDAAVRVAVKPFSAAPIRIALNVEVGDGDA